MISKYLRELLVQKNLNQSDLAALAGVSLPQINNIINNRSNPHKRTLKKIAAALGVPVDDLILSDEIAAGRNGDFMGYFLGATFIMTAVGDSMAPRIRGGDQVAAYWLQEDDMLQWNNVYIVVTETEKMIRRVKPSPDPAKITLICDNNQYDAMQLQRSQVLKFGRVVGFISLI